MTVHDSTVFCTRGLCRPQQPLSRSLEPSEDPSYQMAVDDSTLQDISLKHETSLSSFPFFVRLIG